MADGDFTGTCPKPEGYGGPAPCEFRLSQIIHRTTVDEGRNWAYVALGIPLGIPGGKLWDETRHPALNPKHAHWANQPFWAAT